MPINLEFGGIELTGDPQRQPFETTRKEEGSVRIGVIGDFRGRGTRAPVELTHTQAERCLLPVDRDNIDEVLARLCPELSLTLPEAEGTPVVLTFREVDDFHPDRILARAEVFAALRKTRSRLEDPSTFAEAAAEIGVGARPAELAPAPPPPAANVTPAELLDLILQQSSPSTPPPPAPPAQVGAWGAFLEQITAPHIHRENPRQAELIAGVDAAMAQLLRDILHHPEFQALESLWRGVKLLTRRLDTGTNLALELIDLPRAALEADLLSTKPLDSTAAYKLLVEPSVGIQGGRSWTFLVGDFTFGPSRRDIVLLWRLGQIARLAAAPFLAAANPQIVGSNSLASTPDPDDWSTPPADEGWSDLRRSSEAPYLGLALPRFLLRAPYGRERVPIEAFAFEEFPVPPAHASYLWGNPAFALAVLLGSSFNAQGRFDRDRFAFDLTELPLSFESTDDGGTRVKPCAEVLLGTRAADRLLGAGLMPFQSIRNRDTIRLAQLVSIADPPAPLAIP
ncbi:MAG: type VI secretion system contractile sheath large subunit [Planctomycetaceae bacterium]|nr:type VI secretion system contractile sheath large subunit [Planctomycetaceae bacterium]